MHAAKDRGPGVCVFEVRLNDHSPERLGLRGDDFGAGYTSLAHLEDLPIQQPAAGGLVRRRPRRRPG
jgi:hypothetical protein